MQLLLFAKESEDRCSAEVLVDLTIGRGGHAALLIEGAGSGNVSRVVGFDRDAENCRYAQQRLERAFPDVHVEVIHSSFVHVRAELMKRSVAADVVLADLGFASNQMEDAARGLSFQDDGPLDMRLDRDSVGRTGRDVLAESSESDLAEMIFRFGEEPLARRIAREIVSARKQGPIETTSQLAAIVRTAYGSRAHQSRMQPATRTFMALRIAVNDELAALEVLLDSLGQRANWLAPDARVAIICFHSLEDRLVKRSFRGLQQRGMAELLTPKPIVADAAEIASNPRSRSAKLRAIAMKT